MHDRFLPTTDSRVDDGRTTTGRFASRFFVAAAGVFAAAFSVTAALRAAFPPARYESLHLPPAFAATTALLVAVSASMVRAVRCVRREKQQPFRQSLFLALAGGTLFVGIQAYGLLCLLSTRPPIHSQTGALAFVFVFAAMHALHVTVALLFLLFVIMRARRDRYDHEYYWGVSVAGWFWHALGIVWLGILFVIVMSV